MYSEVNSLNARRPHVFKIGITRDPMVRWHYYTKESVKWHGMRVIYMGDHPLVASLLESVLIRSYIGTSGCHNVAKGGESALSEGGPPYCLYLVFKNLDPPEPHH